MKLLCAFCARLLRFVHDDGLLLIGLALLIAGVAHYSRAVAGIVAGLSLLALWFLLGAARNRKG